MLKINLSNLDCNLQEQNKILIFFFWTQNFCKNRGQKFMEIKKGGQSIEVKKK